MTEPLLVVFKVKDGDNLAIEKRPTRVGPREYQLTFTPEEKVVLTGIEHKGELPSGPFRGKENFGTEVTLTPRGTFNSTITIEGLTAKDVRHIDAPHGRVPCPGRCGKQRPCRRDELHPPDEGCRVQAHEYEDWDMSTHTRMAEIQEHGRDPEELREEHCEVRECPGGIIHADGDEEVPDR